jgi:hypothetical protein
MIIQEKDVKTRKYSENKSSEIIRCENKLTIIKSNK